MKSSSTTKVDDDGQQQQQERVSPEASANIFEKLSYWYYGTLVSLAQQKPLTEEDLFPLLPEDICANVVDSFQTQWDLEMARVKEYNINRRISGEGKKDKKPNLLRVYYNMSPKLFVIAGIMEFILRASLVAGPVVLQELIRFLDDDDKSKGFGFGFAMLLFALSIIGGFAENAAYGALVRVGVHLQACITGGVYRKSLRLSSKSRQKTGMGTIMNLIGQDTQRIFYLMPFIHVIWSAPLQFVVIFVLMWQLIGILPTIPAFVVLIISLILMQYANNGIQRLEVEKMLISDKRVKIVNETLQGIKVVKLYGWEQSLSKRIAKIRKTELDIVFKVAIFRAFLFASFLLTPMLMAVVAFYVMVAEDGEESLTPVRIFGTLALINIIRIPLILYPTLMTNWASAKISFKRIRDFFLLEELNALSSQSNVEKGSLYIKNGTFTWPSKDDVSASTPASKSNDGDDETEEKSPSTTTTTSNDDVELKELNGGKKKNDEFSHGFMLNALDFSVKSGELVEIIGKVGAGKTSFVRALIGDMCEVDTNTQTWLSSSSSSVSFNGKIAYVPQQAWIRNITFRENITFGRQYDRQKYERVLDMCQLLHDRDTLTHGDDTEIGEKGINLSGGQKQRVSLARAVYSGADIYLLDDTLSAVDPHVGKHLFYKCIMQYLRASGKSIILCTHQVQFLEPADRIYIMDAGKFTKSGTFNDLKGDLSDFRQIASDLQDDVDGLDVVPLSRAVSEAKSSSSNKEEKKEDEKDKQNFTTKQKIDQGVVPASVYGFYGRMAGGYIFVGVLGVLYIVSQTLLLLSDWWLASWSNNSFNENNDYYMTLYGILAAAAAFTAFVRIYIYSLGGQQAAEAIHRNLLEKVMQATMTYFDSTPLGRVLDHFAKDMLFIDTYIPMMFDQYGTIMISVVGSLIFIAIITYWFIIPLILVGVLFNWIQKRFLRTSRGVYRMWLNAHGPVYSFVGESLTGVSTIRAYSKENEFVDLMDERLNRVNNMFFHSQMLTRWLDLRLDIISAILIGATASLIVILRDDLSPALSALALTLAVNITGLLGLMVLIGAYMETFMTAVQRIQAMWDTPAERYTGSRDIGKSWPKTGEIIMKDVELCYKPDAPMILKKINVKIPSGSKVGLCGRTGAGKTTITTAMFRLVELSAGSISIDGVDLNTMNLNDIRSRMAIIPQDAVCFEGTVQFNLDPFGENTETELWEVLERVHLKDKITSLKDGLLAKVELNGANFSMGERQLFCMARALLRKPKVLIMDEATASIDNRTDKKLQEMIRTEFSDATVLTIAHRINTIADSDYIMVLDDGKLVEFGSPNELLQDSNSHYAALLGENTNGNSEDERMNE